MSQLFSKAAIRRKELLAQLPEEGLVIIPIGSEVAYSIDGHYPFTPDKNFYYLTGLIEPDAVMVLKKNKQDSEFILFVLPREPDKELWTGKRVGIEGAINQYGANVAYHLSEIEKYLPKWIGETKGIYYNLGVNQVFDNKIINWLKHAESLQRLGVAGPEKIYNINNIISELRLFKDDYEINCMRTVAEISAQAHILAMQNAKKCDYEYQVEAQILYGFYNSGVRKEAYPSIVGAGVNSCVLHYINNNSKINNDDLILIDAGGEYEQYAADITRTFPKSGKFSGKQKDLYEIVLAAQLAGIAEVKPGNKWEYSSDRIKL